MTHLTPEQFIDILDGVRSDTQVPHLTQCASCRQELTELRAASALTRNDDVPEPSPLFWDHLSARVRAAVAAEPDRRAPEWALRWWSWKFGAAAAAAAIAVAVVMTVGWRPSENAAPAVSMSPVTPAALDGTDLAAIDVDPSMQLVADLAAELDWEAAIEAGLGARAGAVERIVPELTDAERLELQRLIQDELARTGA